MYYTAADWVIIIISFARSQIIVNEKLRLQLCMNISFVYFVMTTKILKEIQKNTIAKF
jgi:hypothetical protein